MIGISDSHIWSKSLIEFIFNPCGKFRWSPEDAVTQIHSSHHHDGVPGIFPDLLRSVQMLIREWGAESNGKLPNLFILSKNATLVSQFAVEDLPLSRTATLVPIYIYRLYCMAVKLGLSPWVRSTGYECSRIKYLGRYLGLGEMKLQGNGESYIMLSYMHCSYSSPAVGLSRSGSGFDPRLGQVSLVRFFRSFSSPVRQMSGSFRPPRSPNIICPSLSSSIIIHYGRQWPDMLTHPKPSNIGLHMYSWPSIG